MPALSSTAWARRSPGPPRNRLLNALPAGEVAQLLPQLEFCELERGRELIAPGAALDHVYFPESAVIALLAVQDDGQSLEIGTAGYEGMAGVAALLGRRVAGRLAVVLVAGSAYRCPAVSLCGLIEASPAARGLFWRYAGLWLDHVIETGLCNAAHRLDQRCARWILQVDAATGGARIPVTHDFVAALLGVRRAGVTLAMQALQQAGAINYRRGSLEVVDRTRLAARACGCYDRLRAEYERLLASPLLVTA